jgi:pimeloyl-ACP methyl ester carboxylesterase
MCHGFGGNRTEFGNAFVRLAERLSHRGMAAYRFDFAACGESDGDLADLTVSDQVDQVSAVLDVLTRHREIDAGGLSLLGMSLGGLTASLAAAKCEVNALALWAPAATAIAASGTAEVEYWPEVLDKGYWDFYGLPVYRGFFEDGYSIDPWGDAASYAGPVLFAFGDGDVVVPREAVDRYRVVYGDRFEEHCFAGVGHGFENIPARERLLGLTEAFLLRYARPLA